MIHFSKGKKGKKPVAGATKKKAVRKLQKAPKGAVSKKPGMVKGGEKGRDKIPALLTNGEFVVNAKASKHYRQLLEMINSPKMFGGGDLDNDGDWGDWGGDDGESDSDDGLSDDSGDYGGSDDGGSTTVTMTNSSGNIIEVSPNEVSLFENNGYSTNAGDARTDIEDTFTDYDAYTAEAEAAFVENPDDRQFWDDDTKTEHYEDVNNEGHNWNYGPTGDGGEDGKGRPKPRKRPIKPKGDKGKGSDGDGDDTGKSKAKSKAKIKAKNKAKTQKGLALAAAKAKGIGSSGGGGRRGRRSLIRKGEVAKTKKDKNPSLG